MFKNIINLFFPEVCAGCHSLLILNESVICSFCRHNIPFTNYHLNKENELFKKFYGRIPIEFATAIFYFHKKGIVQRLIYNLKYKGQEKIGTILGKWYAEDLKNIEILKTIDQIIPVPLHKKKQKERGYNQLNTFGKALSKELNLTYNDSILYRKIYSKTQSKKNLFDRSKKIDSIFDVTFTDKDYNKHFLLIDDVITSGSTIESCSNALLKIPNAKISIICIAIAHG